METAERSAIKKIPMSYMLDEDDEEENEGKSIRWVVIVAMILVAYVAWGCLAAAYAGRDGNTGVMGMGGGRLRSRGIMMMISLALSFLVTSVTQIPNVFSVISWNFSNRLWLPVLFIVVEICIGVGGIGLQKLENNLAQPTGRRKKKKRRKKRPRQEM